MRDSEAEVRPIKPSGDGEAGESAGLMTRRSGGATTLRPYPAMSDRAQIILGLALCGAVFLATLLGGWLAQHHIP